MCDTASDRKMSDDTDSDVKECDTASDRKTSDDTDSNVKECDSTSDRKLSDDNASNVKMCDSTSDVKKSDIAGDVETSDVKMCDGLSQDSSFCRQDGTLFQHTVSDASRPGDHANPCGLSINSRGDVSHTSRYAKPSLF